ncbi:calcium-binding protein [Streptomyces sp. Act143]|uniref:calcium-binding protein n=1 Tax=Streptomyces sp. Act143 TaxID=2200760 RepID=UPI000D677E53|nr:calcium-binding protein [Streptomyces sp. Act143]PWI19340.1 calcium-binding protein [Streptomyces sp. Act143]
MRKLAVGILLPSTVALSALTGPAAEAVTGDGDLKITNVSINGGKSVVVGTTTMKTFILAITATDSSGINGAYSDVWSTTTATGFGYHENLGCKAVNATTATCSMSYVMDPGSAEGRVGLDNAQAGGWNAYMEISSKDHDVVTRNNQDKFYVKRYAKLTTDASPEPVRKGGTLTVTGKLSRANWDDNAYHGYAGQSVKLQFRKAGTSTYTTVKTITTSSTGSLRTTVTAFSDGYWRYAFAGTTTTASAKATGDYVDTK